MAQFDEIRKSQDQIIAGWAVSFIQNQKRQIRKSKAVASGDLARSFRMDGIDPSDLRLVSSVIFSFHYYGRFLDMRRLDRSDQIPTEDVIRWIKAKGIGKFISKFKKYRPGYKGTDQTQLINQIAWGIVKGKQKKGRHRRKGWYNKHKERQFGRLMDSLVELYITQGIKSAKQALIAKK